MGGNLNQVTRTIAAGERTKIPVDGDFFYIAAAGAALLYTIRDKQGQPSTLRMSQGDGQRASDPFVEIDVYNDTAASVEITVYGGRGDFDRPPSSAQGASGSSSASSSSPATVAQNGSRRAIFAAVDIQTEPPTTGLGLEVRPTGISGTTEAFLLMPGERILLETTEECEIGWNSSLSISAPFTYGELT